MPPYLGGMAILDAAVAAAKGNAERRPQIVGGMRKRRPQSAAPFAWIASRACVWAEGGRTQRVRLRFAAFWIRGGGVRAAAGAPCL